MTGLELMVLLALLVGPVGFVAGLIVACVLVRDAFEDWQAEFNQEDGEAMS